LQLMPGAKNLLTGSSQRKNNMAYSLLQIAAAYNRPYPTTCKHVQKLIKTKRFEKKSPGKFFDELEVKQLEKLMHFKFRDLK